MKKYSAAKRKKIISNKDSTDEMFDGKGDRIRIPEKRETETNKVVYNPKTRRL